MAAEPGEFVRPGAGIAEQRCFLPPVSIAVVCQAEVGCRHFLHAGIARLLSLPGAGASPASRQSLPPCPFSRRHRNSEGDRLIPSRSFVLCSVSDGIPFSAPPDFCCARTSLSASIRYTVGLFTAARLT